MSTKAVVQSPMGSKSPATSAAPVAAPATTPRKKRVSTVDPNETAEAKFKRLAEARIVRVLKLARQVRLLGRLKPTEAQTKKAFGVINEAFKSAEAAWQGAKAEESGFTL